MEFIPASPGIQKTNILMEWKKDFNFFRHFKIILLGYLCLNVQIPRAYAQEIHHNTLIVHFPFNLFDLNEADANKLRDYLNNPEFPNKRIDLITVTGHTDTIGTNGYNMQLSLRRAYAVEDFIRKSFRQGPSAKLDVVGMGKKRPIGAIDSLNRRVEVTFSYRSDSLQDDTITISIEKDTAFTLDNIHFIEDSPLLTGSSRMALPDYIRYLKKYKNRSLQVIGYCNYLKADLKESDPLFKLSVQRAKLIYDYLIEAGFDPRKLSFKGAGNSKLKNAKPATEDQERENMRVEVEIH